MLSIRVQYQCRRTFQPRTTVSQILNRATKLEDEEKCSQRREERRELMLDTSKERLRSGKMDPLDACSAVLSLQGKVQHRSSIQRNERVEVDCGIHTDALVRFIYLRLTCIPHVTPHSASWKR